MISLTHINGSRDYPPLYYIVLLFPRQEVGWFHNIHTFYKHEVPGLWFFTLHFVPHTSWGETHIFRPLPFKMV